MFVIIMGVAGSGKTTIATLLSEALGWPMYDADDFHSPENIRKMASGVALTDADRAPWLEKLRQLIAEHNERGENGVLACSALKEAYRQTLRSTDDEVALVYLKAQPDLVRSRLDNRKGHYMPKGLIESQFIALEEPQNSVVVDAAWPATQSVAAIRSALAK